MTDPQPSTLEARLADKQRQLASVTRLRDLSATLLADLESLATNLDTLAGGAEAVAAVLQNWHNVTRAVSLAASNLAEFGEEDYESGEKLPETLVRMKLPE